MILTSRARAVVVLHLIFLIVGGTSHCAGADGNPTTQVVIVSTPPDHPPGSHLYADEAKVLEACLLHSDRVRVARVDLWPPEHQVLADADVLVYYSKPIGDMVLHPDHRHRFLETMQRGTGLVAIHWSTGVGYGPLANEETLRDEFRGILGGWFRRPPGDVRIDELPIEVQAADHPILRGVHLTAARDEFYLSPVMHESARTLLQVTLDQQTHPVGWAFERPESQQGRSVGITLGHFHDRFEDEHFRRLLTNAILWAAHREVPMDGAPIESPQR